MSTSATLTHAAALVRKTVEDSQSPIAFNALKKRTGLPVADLKEILESERTRRALHAWPAFRGQQRYWHVAPEEFARHEVLAVASECALPAAVLARQVKKRSHGYPAKLISAAVQELVRAKELRKYPGFGRDKELLGPEGQPSAYAAAAELAIQAIRDKLAAAGAQRSASLDEAILQAMSKLEPSGSVPVSVRELRVALPLAAKPAFDEAALRLRSQRRVFLSLHDFPGSLSPAERDALIDGQDGAFYVAITARHD